MEVRSDFRNSGDFSQCPVCGQEELFVSYDETVWCPDCDWHTGISCKEFFCPGCGSYEIRYEDNRAVCKECGCTVILDCEGIVPRSDAPGKYKLLRLKRAVLCAPVSGLDKSFSEFTELEEVVLPQSLEAIRFDAFSGCTALRKVNIPLHVRVIEGNAFLGTAITGIRLPENITEIADFSFCDCHQLKQITIPEKVTRIGTAAFQRCTALEEVILPVGMKRIDCGAFNGCTSLKHMVIPPDTDVDPGAFGTCTGIVVERK